jgi:hypothetical protein
VKLRRVTRHPRRLIAEQRRELLRLTDVVPRDADGKHPAVRALADYYESLDLPWWAPAGGSVYLRLGQTPIEDSDLTALDVGLEGMRRIAATEDFGPEPWPREVA